MITILNENLVKRQRITEETIVKLHAVYDKLNDVIENPENFNNPVELIQEMEFELQALWKFPIDADFHAHWLRIKGCECPKMDNRERMGTPYRIYSVFCPWHGLIGELEDMNV